MAKMDLIKEGVILRPTELEFENKAVFNPGILQIGNTVHMVYRAIDENNKSCLGYARLEGPKKIVERWTKPFMYPRFKYEKKGIEDPRITVINGQVYMTYVVHDGKNALTAYAMGKDIFHLKKQGIISPQIRYSKAGKLFGKSRLKDDYYTFKSFYTDNAGQDVLIWDKDCFLFPEKIKNQYVLMHRILPDVQIAAAKHMYFLKTKEYWERNISNLAKNVVLEPKHGWENRHVGGGCPPIRTKYGWLLIYHGVEESNDGRVYHSGAAILKYNNPTKVIARLPVPFMSPDKKYEMSGTVNDVTFPTGTAIFDERLYIYYGTADTSIAVASVNLENFCQEIMKFPVKD